MVAQADMNKKGKPYGFASLSPLHGDILAMRRKKEGKQTNSEARNLHRFTRFAPTSTAANKGKPKSWF